MANNLPPGCNDDDLPGNRPEDIRGRWEVRQREAVSLALSDELEKVFIECDLSDCEGEEEAREAVAQALVNKIGEYYKIS